jgi:WD40 repeat protein
MAAANGEVLSIASLGNSIVAATQDGYIHVLDAKEPGAPARRFRAGTFIRTIAVVEWRNQPVVFATVNVKNAWSVRAWNLESFAPLQVGKLHLTSGEEDKMLHGLAVRVDSDVAQVAFAGKYGKVMVATIPCTRVGIRDFDEWHVPEGVNDYTYSLAIRDSSTRPLLMSGMDDGRVVLWDLTSGELIADRRDMHRGAVNVVCVRPGLGDWAIASGGGDGIVWLWTRDLEPMLSVDVGAPVLSLAWTDSNRLAIGTTRGLLSIEPRHPIHSARFA